MDNPVCQNNISTNSFQCCPPTQTVLLFSFYSLFSSWLVLKEEIYFNKIIYKNFFFFFFTFLSANILVLEILGSHFVDDHFSSARYFTLGEHLLSYVKHFPPIFFHLHSFVGVELCFILKTSSPFSL